MPPNAGSVKPVLRKSCGGTACFAGSPTSFSDAFTGTALRAVRRLDMGVRQGPVLRVSDASDNLCFDVNVLGGHVDEGRILIGIGGTGVASTFQ
jgi:hypothetical protein